MSNDRVWSVMVDGDGRVWAGTEDGLNVLDPGKGGFHAYRADPSDPSALSHNTVSRIYRDSRGILWVATLGGGLNRWDEERQAFVSYRYRPGSPVSLSDNTVWDITEDKAGCLWVATQSGVDLLDPLGVRFPHHHKDPENPLSLSNNHVTA